MPSWWYDCSDVHKLRYHKAKMQSVLDKELNKGKYQLINNNEQIQTEFKPDCNVGLLPSKYDYRKIITNPEKKTLEIQYYKKQDITEAPQMVMYDVFREENSKLCQYKHIYQANILTRALMRIKMPLIFITNSIKYNA
jgi:hypothetical protein